MRIRPALPAFAFAFAFAFLCLAATAATAATATTAGAADWPHQRGPSQNGHLPEGAPAPETLPDDPRVVWKIPAADGFAAPIISGGRVIYGELENGKEVFRAVSFADGKRLWSDVLDDPHKDGFGTGPRCAPVSDGAIALIQSCKGALHCLDAATGELRWKANYLTDFGAPYVGEKGTTEGSARHGYASSPLIDGDHVIALAGGPGAAVVCFDKASGKVAWRSQDDQAAYAPPQIAVIGGVRQVVCFTVGGLIGLDRAGGRLLWRVPLATKFGRHVAAPVIRGDLVIAGSHEIGLVAARVTKAGGGFQAEEAWRLGSDRGPNFASPIAIGDHLYTLAGNEVACLDLRTGEQA
ncbi:MAG: PQQ-binding-like beta-propeller repeat protein, partial [Verrucomicrobiales bacterium]